jgi:hypothetical protein
MCALSWQRRTPLQNGVLAKQDENRRTFVLVPAFLAAKVEKVVMARVAIDKGVGLSAPIADRPGLPCVGHREGIVPSRFLLHALNKS